MNWMDEMNWMDDIENEMGMIEMRFKVPASLAGVLSFIVERYDDIVFWLDFMKAIEIHIGYYDDLYREAVDDDIDTLEYEEEEIENWPCRRRSMLLLMELLLQYTGADPTCMKKFATFDYE